MEDQLEKAFIKVADKLSIGIRKILLKDFSKDRTDWIMDDIDHIIYSHAINEMLRIIEDNIDEELNNV